MNVTSRHPSHDPRRLYRKRVEAGLTFDELARRAGVGKGTISRAENGGGLRVKTLHRLAEALGCPVTDLMYADPEPAKA